MRVVVCHDYLTQRGGAERVVLEMLRAFPGARLVTSVYDPKGTYPEFASRGVETTWLDRVPAFRRDPRRALPVLAPTFSRLHVKDADVVICSSSGWAHGVSTDAPKIVYCHNTARWLYQRDEYLATSSRAVAAPLAALRPALVRWDRGKAARAAAYVANSQTVAERIRRTYGRRSTVLHPPRGIDPDGPATPVDGVEPGYMLTIGRARGYKNTELLAESVTGMADERLVCVGGTDAGGPRVLSLPRVSDSELRWLYRNAGGVLAAAHEDFGLTPVEAFAFGKPVAALRAGGYLETVVPGLSGVWIENRSRHGVQEAVRHLRSTDWDADTIRRHAGHWDPSTFRDGLRKAADAVASGVRS